MSSPNCPTTTKTILGEWEDVYSVQDVPTSLWTEELPPELNTDTIYYQTFGGGPEGGYFVKDPGGPTDTVYRVTRSWFQPWRVEELKNIILEYEPADEAAGQTARCRKIEVYSIRETREIVDTHLLSGNAVEIVKCLRDGLSPKADEDYKNLCLGIILHHFQQIDSYLDLLPKDIYPTYKEVLESLAKKHADKEDGESSSEESDSE
jgi:hypothetical protein